MNAEEIYKEQRSHLMNMNLCWMAHGCTHRFLLSTVDIVYRDISFQQWGSNQTEPTVNLFTTLSRMNKLPLSEIQKVMKKSHLPWINCRFCVPDSQWDHGKPVTVRLDSVWAQRVGQPLAEPHLCPCRTVPRKGELVIAAIAPPPLPAQACVSLGGGVAGGQERSVRKDLTIQNMHKSRQNAFLLWNGRRRRKERKRERSGGGRRREDDWGSWHCKGTR